MKSKLKLLIAGGDKRFISSAEKFSQYYETYAVGFTREQIPDEHVILCDVENVPACDAVVLPVPVSVDGVNVNAPFSEKNIPLSLIIPHMKHDAIVYGGKFNGTESLFQNAGFVTCDYVKNEEFSVRNAVPSAEGALQILLEELPVTVAGSRILVLGFGRIGSYLAKILHALGADVTVVARKPEALAKAQQIGCHAVYFDELPEIVRDADAICNTVPVVVLNGGILEKVRKNCLIVDLASRPTGGTDFSKARELQLKTIWALGLPAKVAPVTAGEIIAQIIITMQKERRE